MITLARNVLHKEDPALRQGSQELGLVLQPSEALGSDHGLGLPLPGYPSFFQKAGSTYVSGIHHVRAIVTMDQVANDQEPIPSATVTREE
jgi:hypothetical protein